MICINCLESSRETAGTQMHPESRARWTDALESGARYGWMHPESGARWTDALEWGQVDGCTQRVGPGGDALESGPGGDA